MTTDQICTVVAMVVRESGFIHNHKCGVTGPHERHACGRCGEAFTEASPESVNEAAIERATAVAWWAKHRTALQAPVTQERINEWLADFVATFGRVQAEDSERAVAAQSDSDEIKTPVVSEVPKGGDLGSTATPGRSNGPSRPVSTTSAFYYGDPDWTRRLYPVLTHGLPTTIYRMAVMHDPAVNAGVLQIRDRHTGRVIVETKYQDDAPPDLVIVVGESRR